MPVEEDKQHTCDVGHDPAGNENVISQMHAMDTFDTIASHAIYEAKAMSKAARMQHCCLFVRSAAGRAFFLHDSCNRCHRRVSGPPQQVLVDTLSSVDSADTLSSEISVAQWKTRCLLRTL